MRGVLIRSVGIMRNFEKYSLLVILAAALFFLGCEREEPRPDPAADYEAYIGWASRKVCSRILSCFESLYRSVSPAMQKEITVDNCAATALEDIKLKIALHTPSMKSNSVKCYETLFEANCLDFGTLAYWDPSCMMLRRETDAVYKKAREEAAR